MTMEAPPAVNVAREYAASLLECTHSSYGTMRGIPHLHPDLEWAASGSMALTGPTDAAPMLPRGPLASAARGAIAALVEIAARTDRLDAGSLASLDGPALLGERAAILGLGRRGTTAPSGSCHLFRCLDGWIAVNLARAEDVGLLPAWLGEGDASCSQTFVATRAAGKTVIEIIARARELGLPAAPASGFVRHHRHEWRCAAVRGPSLKTRAARPPLVVDLSTLWAGPLCTHLLKLTGAEVVRVESARRPDGARRGPRAFYDLINAGKRSVALDLAANEGVSILRALIGKADIVVESARPRALANLGIHAEEMVAKTPGLVWVSITGYGRRQPQGNWVAFGDDAGAAAGLTIDSAVPEGVPMFCGDAIADPLTGIHAAVAALDAWRRGDAVLLDVALRDVASYAAGFAMNGKRGLVHANTAKWPSREWVVTADGKDQPVLRPRARSAVSRAAELGADTTRVLGEMGIRC